MFPETVNTDQYPERERKRKGRGRGRTGTVEFDGRETEFFGDFGVLDRAGLFEGHALYSLLRGENKGRKEKGKRRLAGERGKAGERRRIWEEDVRSLLEEEEELV